MTVAELLQRLPKMREWFPQPIVQEWSMSEWLAGMKRTEERTLAALDRWKAENNRTAALKQ